jgi:hypothetical protein
MLIKNPQIRGIENGHKEVPEVTKKTDGTDRLKDVVLSVSERRPKMKALSGFDHEVNERANEGVLKRILLFCSGLFMILILLSLQSCAVYEPVPVYAEYRVNSYEIAWENAQRAAEDVGIRITSVDEASGTIVGQADQTAVSIRVIKQPGERIRLEVSLRGPSRESYIAGEFHRAYERRMAGK